MSNEKEQEDFLEKSMTVDEVYEFITSKMSAEQALKLLLSSASYSYEKLKLEEGEAVHPIMIIAMAAIDLGWDIALENKDGESDVRGMIVGTEEYFNDNNLNKIE